MHYNTEINYFINFLLQFNKLILLIQCTANDFQIISCSSYILNISNSFTVVALSYLFICAFPLFSSLGTYYFLPPFERGLTRRGAKWGWGLISFY